VLPDGSRNAGFQLQRLKDKLGNRSNASSEVEFRAALAQMVGEPGPRRADDHRDGQPHAP
jgi:putative acyl-CoA dehydrogenase